MLLGLPFSDSAVSTVALATASGRHRHGQSPLTAAEESDESFGETAPDEGVIEETRGAVANFSERLARSFTYETDTPRDFPRAPRRDGAPFSREMRENAADGRSTLTEPSAEHREQTRLVVPGASTHRTDFPALSLNTDTPTISVDVEGEPWNAIPQQAARLSAPVSLPRARERTTSDVKLLTRLEQLVTEGARPLGMQNGERGGQDLAQRFEQLQRTVRDLAATVSSQAARSRDESQLQSRDQKRTPLQRTVIIKHSEASSTAPRAFWERSRLGRFYLRSGR